VPLAGRVEGDRATGRRPVADQRAHHPTPAASPAAAVLDLQRACGNRAVTRLLAVQRDPAKDLVAAGKRLGDVQGWVNDKQRSQKALDTSAVVGLDLSQKANVVEAIRALSAALPALRTASSPFAPGLAALRQALERTRATEAALKEAADELDRHRAGQILKAGQAAMARAITALKGVAGVSPKLKQNLETLHGNMNDTRGIHDTFNGISRVIREVEALGTDQGVKPEAVERVLFLLRSFVAVNDPASAHAPKPAEALAMKDRLESESMQDDFVEVFGSASQFALLIDYTRQLLRQIDVRDSMAKAGAPTGQVPSETDARAYFTKLQKRPNAEVFNAYTAFMSAFFYHKVVAGIGELTATNTALMSVPSSITGTRPLVCTGYATLGAELLSLAGATRGEITIGFRASDTQLLSGDEIDAGHAIAKVSRGSQARYVSNHLVVGTEEDGIGPDAVAWTNKDNPLIRGKGPTMAAAVTAVMDALGDARAAARARSAKTKPKKPRP
jgi:hypothetical protein